MSDSRKVVIEWGRNGRTKPSWWATYPAGNIRWYHDQNTNFMTWVLGFLRNDGDVVEIHYPKTITTYAMTTRKRDDHHDW